MIFNAGIKINELFCGLKLPHSICFHCQWSVLMSFWWPSTTADSDVCPHSRTLSWHCLYSRNNVNQFVRCCKSNKNDESDVESNLVMKIMITSARLQLRTCLYSQRTSVIYILKSKGVCLTVDYACVWAASSLRVKSMRRNSYTFPNISVTIADQVNVTTDILHKDVIYCKVFC